MASGYQSAALVPALFSYQNMVHAIAGAAGSVTAMAVFFPLDTVRTRLQVDDRPHSESLAVAHEIVVEEGWSALYRGLQPVLISLCCSNFVYFYTFNGLKLVLRRQQIEASSGKDLLMAIISGVVNVLTTTPLWVANTRLRLQGARIGTPRMSQPTSLPSQPIQYRNILDAVLKIGQNEGLAALWSSTIPSLLLVSNPAVQFMVYETAKRRLLTAGDVKKLRSFQVFLIGALAKMASTILTYPLQLAQARLRARRSRQLLEGTPILSTHGLFASLLACLQDAYLEGGFRGLFKGLDAKLLQTVLTSAMMFVAYEKIAAIIFKLLRYSAPVKSK